MPIKPQPLIRYHSQTFILDDILSVLADSVDIDFDISENIDVDYRYLLPLIKIEQYAQNIYMPWGVQTVYELSATLKRRTSAKAVEHVFTVRTA